ncbi:hypothetical protein WN48_00521 [Eufriesea mexicana]|nr:hypothetical protein WN48_00521 [Eufriesea mexicana]
MEPLRTTAVSLFARGFSSIIEIKSSTSVQVDRLRDLYSPILFTLRWPIAVHAPRRQPPVNAVSVDLFHLLPGSPLSSRNPR